MSPTVFHITHIKAGSQWVAEVLKYSALARFVPPQPRLGHILDAPIQPGQVYPTVYMSQSDAATVLATTQHPYRMFVVLRDLRDTLISLYFSLKISHAITNDFQQRLRAMLQDTDVTSGLLLLIGREEDRTVIQEQLAKPIQERYKTLATWKANRMPPSTDMGYIAAMQRSWKTADDVLRIRYEDLVADEYTTFERIIAFSEIAVPKDHLHNIVKHNTFEAVTGRPRGQEDRAAHQRKGIAGDWRTYFTDRVKDQFKTMYGDVLIATGYEQDFDW